MRVKVYLIGLAVSLLCVGQVIGQEHRVTGHVISGENRAPLHGVNIVVQGTGMGTVTDAYGLYVLEDVSVEDILVFSYIGFQVEEAPIDGREVLDVVMTPQALSGEDVVVIGYGTTQRRNLTSSIFSLKEGSFTKGATNDLQSLLQARVPGVVITANNGDIGSEPQIRIRGGTSVTAGNGPMVVIDGVPIDNSSAMPDGVGMSNGTRDNPLGMLNPYDIASIDILKDASAAAIYGARGGNGVILITTKQGEAGALSMTYDGYTSTSTVSNKLELLTAAEYKDYAKQVGIHDTTIAKMGDADTDWQDAIFRTAVSQNHNLSFGGGTQLSRYLVSLNYLDEQGIVLNSERQRYSLRLNVNHRMLDEKLRLGLGINPTYVKRNNTPYNQREGYAGAVFTNVFKMMPTYPVENEDGTYYEYPVTTIRNPVALLNEIEDISESIRIFFNATAEYEFVPGLSAKVNLGLDRSGTTRSTYEPRSLPYAAAFGGRADVRNNDRQATLFESALNYKADVGASQLEAWAGYTFQEFENGGFGAVSQDFVTDAWSYNNVGGAANYTERPFSFRDKNRLISFLGRVNLNIADKYLISAALRREGSSRFGADNKWGLFPSGSVGYRLSDALKVRASYGIAGNQNVDSYLSLVTLGPGANAVVGDAFMTGVSATQLANPDLKWEQTSQLNLGLDFGLYRDRISGSVDVYTKTTTDLLLEFDVPQPAVVTSRLDNVGSVENKGIELMLNTVNISTPDFFWRTSLNFAMNRNEVVSLGVKEEGEEIGYIMTGYVGGAGLSDVQSQIIMPGEPFGTFLGYKFEGYDTEGSPDTASAAYNPNYGQEILSSEGGPLDDGRHILGNAQPDFTFGISNIMNYKGIDFRVFVQGVRGVDILNNSRLEYQRPSNVFNGINAFAEVRDEVDAGLAPEAAVAYTDKFIEDGSFIRLQNITLGYTFSTGGFRNLRLYVSGDNLLILTKYTGYDPEVSTDTGYGLGIDYTNYPRARTLTLGLSVGL